MSKKLYYNPFLKNKWKGKILITILSPLILKLVNKIIVRVFKIVYLKCLFDLFLCHP